MKLAHRCHHHAFLLVVSTVVAAACSEKEGDPTAPPPAPTTTPTAGPTGTTPEPPAPPSKERLVSFEPLSHAISDAEKRQVRTSPKVVVDGKEVALSYKTILRGGDVLGGVTFGAITNKAGAPITLADGSTLVDLGSDYTSILPVGKKLFAITHFEQTAPAAMYLTELSQSATGDLTAVKTRPIDFSAWDGVYTPCAGSVSPWGTHLGSEEYEPDARRFAAATQVSEIDSFFRPMLRYFDLDPSTATIDAAKAVLDPYKYGYAIEITVSEDGGTVVQKHFAMGRRALELAYVMPDKKTVYLTDDGENAGFYMFLANKAGDLSAGRLFAMKWEQTSAQNGGAANATWIELGTSATDAEVKALIDAKTTFADIFDVEAPNMDGTCPTAGFVATHAGTANECLKLRPGQELAASRLESRRYAAYVGATTEMNKEEGFTFDPDGMTAYVAISDIGGGMTDGTPADLGGPNHVKLVANPCGGVYSLAVGKDAQLGSDFVVKSWKALVVGEPQAFPPASCHIDKIANPDNVAFVPKYHTLVIGEDCGRAQHQNDAMWTLDTKDAKLTRILTTPYGAEATSPYFYANIGGFAYLTAVVQHPFGESDQTKVNDEPDPLKAKAPYVGYLGPLPKMD